MSRRSQVDIWQENDEYEDVLQKLASWSENNVPLALMADYLGVSEQTITRLRKHNPDVRSALKKGKMSLLDESYSQLKSMANDFDTPIAIRKELWVKFFSKAYRDVHGVAYDDTSSKGECGEDGESRPIQRVFVVSGVVNGEAHN